MKLQIKPDLRYYYDKSLQLIERGIVTRDHYTKKINSNPEKQEITLRNPFLDKRRLREPAAINGHQQHYDGTAFYGNLASTQADVSGVAGTPGEGELFVKLDNLFHSGARTGVMHYYRAQKTSPPYLQTIASEEFEIVEVLESVTLQEEVIDETSPAVRLLLESIDRDEELSSRPRSSRMVDPSPPE
ncbi:hypothetical protein AVEN_113335-1 [Araneus ventricosus]|uniref:Uncharacterized protein n=1 Tax=Araneus ventricosus TaxID=182803 RepID=A0A4Y2HA58_ARAVE|nr:hypothetical protein AVEN_113335-1 [Araneus ventricosus]